MPTMQTSAVDFSVSANDRAASSDLVRGRVAFSDSEKEVPSSDSARDKEACFGSANGREVCSGSVAVVLPKIQRMMLS